LFGIKVIEMKKHIWLAVTLALGLSSSAAFAMDANTLLSHPERYRVVETNGNSLSFVDMKTLRVMETRDYPSSIGYIDGTLYVVETVKNPSVMDYQNNRLVTDIHEYKLHLFGDKEKGEYKLDNTVFVQSCDAEGEAIKEIIPFATKSASQLFTNLTLVNDSKVDEEQSNGMVTFMVSNSSNRVTWNDDNYISGIRSYMYMENWMAHPEIQAKAYVYDKKMKRNVELKTLTKITNIAQMRQALQNGTAVLYNTRWEKITSSKEFVPSSMTDQYYLDTERNALVLVFQPGDMAPYSDGITYVVIPQKIGF
jgi:hypothetical protein